MKTKLLAQYEVERVSRGIFTLRDQKVILDADLAAVYGVETGALNRAVKRNIRRFPSDFIYQLAPDEVRDLRCQIGISKGQGGRRYLPFVFTEHGAIMAATVLNGPRAVQMSVFVVRAFVRMRAALSNTAALARKLATLEREVKARLDTHDAAIVDVLRRFMEILAPPAPPDPPPKPIGFGVKEKTARYGARRKRAHSLTSDI